MKNLIYLCCLFCFFAVSCERDESKEPRPSVVAGEYVRIDISSNRVLDFDNINSTFFGGTITTPGNNIDRFIMKVKRRNSGVWSGDFVLLPIEINSFPFELKITPQILASALNIDVSALKATDGYLFRSESVDKNGKIISYNDLSAVVKNQASMKQAYQIVTQFLQGSNYQNVKSTYNNYDTSFLSN